MVNFKNALNLKNETIWRLSTMRSAQVVLAGTNQMDKQQLKKWIYVGYQKGQEEIFPSIQAPLCTLGSLIL